ncbi:recombinase family protein [Oscillospiraceae bacterium PP1C4]
MAHLKKQEQNDYRKIAIYARKSKITETGKSVENQIAKCKSYAELKFDTPDENILVYQDEGLSGYYSDRPQYMRMLQDIQDNKIKAVICYKFDRISRRTLDLLNLVEQLKTKKIAFISCTDDVDTSSKTGKIVMSLLASIAEFERDIIAERIADNMYELAKEGRWLGGTTPTGYYSKKEHISVSGKKTTMNHLEPIADEQIIVKEIFQKFMEARSLGKVCEYLKGKQILTKNGREHNRTSVKNILANPVYAIADEDTFNYFKSFDVPVYADKEDFDSIRGLMIYNKTEQIKELKDNSTTIHPVYVQRKEGREIEDWIISVGQHKGLIAGKNWIKVQSILQDNKDRFSQPNEESNSLLSGLVRCPICGEGMYTRKLSGRYTKDNLPRYNYVCKTKFKDKNACSCKDLNGNDLDDFIIQSICSISDEDNEYYQLLADSHTAIQTQYDSGQQQKQQAEKRLMQIEKEMDSQTANLRLAPESIKPILFSDIEKLSAEQGELQNKLDQIKVTQDEQEKKKIDLAHVREIVFSFPKLVEVLSYQDKMELIRTVVNKVIVTTNEKDEQEAHIFLKGAKEQGSMDFFEIVPERRVMCQHREDSIFNAS